MNESTRGIGRKALYTSMVGAMVLSIMPAAFAAPTSAAAAQACRNINKIDVCGRFLEQWNKSGTAANAVDKAVSPEQGSTYVNGLPITAMKKEISLTDGKTYDTQWFERARYEAHPENKAPYDVLLGLLGVTITEGRGSIDPQTKQVRNPSDAAFVGVDKPGDTSATKVWFQETKHTVSGKILEYWNKFGGLQQFGFPLSEQFKEISTDGKTYDVQYFERNKFEIHPEKAAPYEVELGLLGVQQYKTQAQDVSTLPQNPPSGVTSARPNLNVAMSQEPSDLTFLSNQAVTTYVLDALEDGLIGEDEQANFYGEDAYYVPTLENGGSYYVGVGGDRHLVTKYKIRRGIKWTDGKELTSNDAVFAYSYHMNPNTNVVSRTLEQKLFNVENPDKYTVIYNWYSVNQGKAFIATLKGEDAENYEFITSFIKANSPIVDPAYFAVASILPQHIIGNIAGNETLSASAYGREGHVGTGPFKVKAWQKGSQMVLEQNPNYSLTAKPLLSTITIKFIEDTNQILAQLKSPDPNQGVDLATSDAFAGPSEAFAQLGPNLAVHSVPSAVWEHIDFRLDYGPFKDVNVRKAIMTAMNREEIVKIAYLGQTVVLNTVSPPLDWMSLQNPNFAKAYPDLAAKYKLPTYAYNPTQAAQMLDAAGWKCPNGQVNCAGQVRAKGGEKLSFSIATTTGNANRQLSVQLTNKYLSDVGVEAKIEFVSSNILFGRNGNVGYIKTGLCKLCLYAWVGDPVLDNFDLWDSSQIPTDAQPDGQNTPLYNNPAFDTAARGFKSDIDRNKTAEFAAQAQVILMTDLPVMPLYPRANIEVVRTSLQNEKTSNSTVSPFFNIPAQYFK